MMALNCAYRGKPEPGVVFAGNWSIDSRQEKIVCWVKRYFESPNGTLALVAGLRHGEEWLLCVDQAIPADIDCLTPWEIRPGTVELGSLTKAPPGVNE